MKLSEFLESSYVTSQQRNEKEYSLYNQASVQAAQSLVNGYRSVSKVIAIVAFVGRFIGVKLGIIQAPKTVDQIYTELRAAMEAEKSRHEQAAKQSASSNETPKPSTSGLTIVN